VVRQVRDSGATGVLAFGDDGGRHGFAVAVLALQPGDGLAQVRKAFSALIAPSERSVVRAGGQRDDTPPSSPPALLERAASPCRRVFLPTIPVFLAARSPLNGHLSSSNNDDVAERRRRNGELPIGT